MPDMPFIQRYNILKELIAKSQNVSLVPTFKVEDHESFMKLNESFVQAGYEGAILRWGEQGYIESKRTDKLLKYKEFLEMDALIIDVVPNEKDPTQGTIVCQIKAGTFKCGMKMSHDARRQVLVDKDKYIGRIANVVYFELTDSGLLRFPIYKGLHQDR